MLNKLKSLFSPKPKTPNLPLFSVVQLGVKWAVVTRISNNPPKFQIYETFDQAVREFKIQAQKHFDSLQNIDRLAIEKAKINKIYQEQMQTEINEMVTHEV